MFADGPSRLVGSLLAATIVSRWLVPTESAALGDTLWLAQGTLVLCLMWSLVAAWRGTSPIRWRLSDTAVSLLVAGHVLSSLLVVAGTGDKRAAVNLLCEWISLAALWFLIRQAVVRQVDREALTVTLLATATMLAAFGIWQHYVWYPEHVRLYESPRRELDELLRIPEPRSPQTTSDIQRLERRLLELGVPAECLEGLGRTSFESRLLHSREPLAAFALTNSLAGLLLPHWVIAVSAAAAGWRLGTRQRWLMLTLVLCGLLTYCLLLTKSRTAYVGLMCGVCVLVVSRMRQRDNSTPQATSHTNSPKRWPFGLGLTSLIAIALIVLAFQTGGLDRFVLAQAPKSLKYRLEYWAGTWDVLKEHPRNWLFGVGPGNFRQHYLRFKRPGSSEEIADPHQFLLDVWVNGGIIGLSGALLLCWVSVRLLRPRTAAFVQQPDDSVRKYSSSSSDHDLFNHPFSWGAGLASAVILWLKAPHESVAIGLMLLWLLSIRAWTAIVRLGPSETIRGDVFGASLVSLAVHLLGAGGIGMPAITQVWFVWLAVGNSAGEPTPASDRELIAASMETRWRSWSLMAVLVIMNLTCLFTATRPVHERREFEESAMSALTYDRNIGAAETRWRHATATDPWSSEPWLQLADLTFHRWLLQSDSIDLWNRAVEYQQEAINRDPRQPGSHRTLGHWQLQRFARTHDSQDAAAAERSLVTAAELYPNHSGIQAELSDAAHAAGNAIAARAASERALELDTRNLHAGHSDKLLDERTRQRLQQRLGLLPAAEGRQPHEPN